MAKAREEVEAMKINLRGYKLCKHCGCPILKKGQKRKHSDAYRHAQGCPYNRAKPFRQKYSDGMTLYDMYEFGETTVRRRMSTT